MTLTKYTPKWFSEKEFNRIGCSIADINPGSLARLDLLRESIRRPIRLSSAYRSRESEIAKGRSGTSAHCLGRAFDIICPDSSYRYNLVYNAINVGFNRIGIGKNFIHVDDSGEHAQNVMWHYY